MTALVVAVMGVAGAGKSTVARRLADELGWDFAEGDDFHSPANIAKMAAGEPLTDSERGPWLDDIARWIDGELLAHRCGVVACSALKRAYRDRLRRPEVVFAYLHASRIDLERRLTERHGHFMPASLLDSQLAALEPPAGDERALAVEVDDDPSRTVERIRERLAAVARREPCA